MKFDCGPTWKEQYEAKEKWHKYFTWFPVRVASHDCRWLEQIQRKGIPHHAMGDLWWTWEYRSL